MATHSPADAPAGAAAARPMLGAEGTEFISHTLSTVPPVQAVRAIQERCAMSNPSCAPLLGGYLNFLWPQIWVWSEPPQAQ